MNDIDQSLARVRLLFDQWQQEAHKLMRALGAPLAGDVTYPRIVVIQQACADAFNMPIASMFSSIRTQEYATPRMVAMMICRDLTKHSLDVIGSAFGGRNHGTVAHACKAISAMCSTQKVFAVRVAAVRETCIIRISHLDTRLFTP
jgi:chromosomal replication initiation ATPase DnaA